MSQEHGKISIWVTSTGRFRFLKPTLDAFIKYNTYPNVEFLIVENVPTPESLQFFNTKNIETEKCIEYVKSLDIPKKHIIQPWDKLGKVYNQLLRETGDYYISLEDDCVAVCDPREQFEDGIILLKHDEQLLGIREDLRDPTTVYPESPRFQGTKMNFGMEYIYWNICSGGAQLMDANKARKIGGYFEEHPLQDYWEPEKQMEISMRNANMYCAVNCKYYGFLSHEGALSTDGKNREWSVSAYKEYISKGWYGSGPQK